MVGVTGSIPVAPTIAGREWGATMIEGINHHVYRCRDSAATREFYEDFLGLPLVRAFRARRTATGRAVDLLHTAYRIGGGSCLEFFEVPGTPFPFKDQHDFDLHLALETDAETQARLAERAKARGMEVRGPSDHGAIVSIYLRDPSGYVVELAVPKPGRADATAAADGEARAILDDWQATKPRATS
jgi:catechol 2,3-dioxygenase-like lactoylglutathione lyase family enzyme